MCMCVHLCNKQELFTTCSRSSSVLFTAQVFHRSLFWWQVSTAGHTVRSCTFVKAQVKQRGRQHFPAAAKAVPQLWARSPATPTTLCPSRCWKQPAVGAAPQLRWFCGQPVAWAWDHGGRAGAEVSSLLLFIVLFLYHFPCSWRRMGHQGGEALFSSCSSKCRT